jgi:hypothetical protein
MLAGGFVSQLHRKYNKYFVCDLYLDCDDVYAFTPTPTSLNILNTSTRFTTQLSGL